MVADRSSEYQAWGAGRHHVSSGDRKDLKRAKREGRIAEAMLDRRAAMKRCVTPASLWGSCPGPWVASVY
jgi:protein FRG1